MNHSLELAKSFLNKKVTISIDRPLGTKHPKFEWSYPVNYGYVKGVTAPDGEELDAYVLSVNNPLEIFEGIVIAIVHRLKDDDDKLVVVPEGIILSDEEIERAIEFQEKWFEHEIIRQ